MATKRMTVSLKEKDLQAAETLQGRFGLLSRSEAIRFALRVLAEACTAGVTSLLTSVSVEPQQNQRKTEMRPSQSHRS